MIAHHVVHGEHVTQLGYPEWATDPFYYEALYDGDSDVVANFRSHRIEIDRASISEAGPS